MALSDLITADISAVILNTGDFAESVTRITSDGTRDTFTAIVTLDEPFRDDSGRSPTLYTGTIKIAAADRDLLVPNTMKVEYRDKEWDIVDVGPEVAGMCEVGIRFDRPEHSNAIDLQGNQHEYG